MANNFTSFDDRASSIADYLRECLDDMVGSEALDGVYDEDDLREAVLDKFIRTTDDEDDDDLPMWNDQKKFYGKLAVAESKIESGEINTYRKAIMLGYNDTIMTQVCEDDEQTEVCYHAYLDTNGKIVLDDEGSFAGDEEREAFLDTPIVPPRLCDTDEDGDGYAILKVVMED